jgi:serine phosphatase RsbU (regulator of sigma subunit)
MLRAIFADLDRFVADAPQHDDVTLLLLKAI